MAKGALLLLFLIALLAGAEAQLQRGHRHAHRRSSDDATAAPTTHLHFYFHDTVSGKSPTAVRVVPPPDTSSMSMFGMVNVMDDPLTEGPEPGSGPMGRAQGLYMGSDQSRVGFLQAMNLVFTSGEFNGSTLALLGRNCPLEEVRELPIVGGTGAFRFATGYALLRTHWLDFRTGDATVEYNVYVMH